MEDKHEKTPLLPPAIVINRGSPNDDMEISSESNSFISDASSGNRRPQPVARKPFHYPSVHKVRTRREAGDSAIATYKRYRYYNRLADPSIDTLSIPDHVVPPDFFFPFSALIPQSSKKQSSIVTIFSIWNTMMGTSLLSIPWAIQQAGFACGVAVMLIMGSLCFYTAFRIVSLRNIGDVPDTAIEFPDLCRHLLGKWAEYLSAFFSFIPLLGSAIVYWVLMSNFLYFTGVYIYDSVHHERISPIIENSTKYNDVYCPLHENKSHNFSMDSPGSDHVFRQLWDMHGPIPLYMAACIAPVMSLKSPTFFTKFNALGTLSVVYLIIFTIIKGGQWGIHFEISDFNSIEYVKLFQPTFPVLIGICSLAFFIHNCVLSIMRNQRNPDKNSRDLAIAYFLVGLTYMTIGVTFFTTFPLSKECIEDNLLNNFRSSDLFAAITRIFLLFQVLTLFPLIVYVLRVQLLHFLFGSIYPSIYHVLVLNTIVLIVCILFAIFLPKVGTIIRFCGAFAGLVYIFTLPCLAYLKALRNKNALPTSTLVIHIVIMIFGFCSFVAQFVVS